MRAVIQRVNRASVSVENATVGQIDKGLLVFLGIGKNDTHETFPWLATKIAQLRVFEDEKGAMNHSLLDIHGNVLLISQFTLYGNLRKGNRPSFNRAALPENAEKLYLDFAQHLSTVIGQQVQLGKFGAMMQIDALNHGPVTIIVDTEQKDF